MRQRSLLMFRFNHFKLCIALIIILKIKKNCADSGLSENSTSTIGELLENSTELFTSTNSIISTTANDPCILQPCLNNGTCDLSANTSFGYTCICESSFHGDHCECRNDWCQNSTKDCGPELDCQPLCHTYQCLCNRDGYVADMITRKCEDINECDILDVCNEEHFLCKNIEGNYTCECEEYYFWNSSTNECERDIELGYRNDTNETREANECAEQPCGEYQICYKIPDGYNCTCLDGYILSNENICEEIDFCNTANGHDYCARKNAVCQNHGHNFTCECRPGFIMTKEVCVAASISFLGKIKLVLKYTDLQNCRDSHPFERLSSEISKRIVAATDEDIYIYIISLKRSKSKSRVLGFGKEEIVCKYSAMLMTEKEEFNPVFFNRRLNASCHLYTSEILPFNDACLLGPNLLVSSKASLLASAVYFNACEKKIVEQYCPTEIGTCKNLAKGNYQCDCKTGLRLFSHVGKLPICLDINECADASCSDPNRECVNSFGNYTCNQCKKGYYLSAYGLCEEICAPSPCKNGGTCIMTSWHDYECQCTEEFTGKNCDRIFQELKDSKLTLYIVAGILAGLVFIAFAAGERWASRRERQKMATWSNSVASYEGRCNPTYDPFPH